MTLKEKSVMTVQCKHHGAVNRDVKSFFFLVSEWKNAAILSDLSSNLNACYDGMHADGMSQTVLVSRHVTPSGSPTSSPKFGALRWPVFHACSNLQLGLGTTIMMM